MTIYETIKAAISVKQAAKHYGLNVNRNGMACCPFHNDRHPSLKLNEDYFFCFGCGAKGDVIDLVARLFDLSSYEAAQKLAADFGLDPKPPTAAAMVKPKRPYIRQFREDEMLCFRVLMDYLHLLEDWKVRYAPKTPDDDLDDRFVEACQMIDYIEYLADILTAGDLEERVAVVDELMKNGKVSRGRLGILMQQLTPELAKSFNLKDAKGALIAQIEKDGPADKAGLRDGDIVIEYNGKPIADIRELSQAVASTKPGAKVKVKAMREGKPVNLVIVVGEMPTDGKLNFKKPAASQNNALGANVRPLNDKEKKRVSNGLFVESVYGAAAEAGMRRGDIIISAGGKKIRTEKDLNEVVSKAKGSLAVLVDRNGSREFIPVKLSDEAKK